MMLTHVFFSFLVLVFYCFDAFHVIFARSPLSVGKKELSRTTKRWISLKGGGDTYDDSNIGWMIPPTTTVKLVPEDTLPPPPPPSSDLESYRDEEYANYLQEQPPPPPGPAEPNTFFYMPPPPLPPYPTLPEKEGEDDMHSIHQQHPLFYAQQERQQQYQQQPTEAYLQATISSLQHQLDQAEFVSGNLSETCAHYRALCKTLQAQLESCQEEMQERKIKISQQDLSIIEYQHECEKLFALLSKQNQTIQEYEVSQQAQQQSMQNVTKSYIALQESHKKTLDDLITLSASIEKYREEVSTKSLQSQQKKEKEVEEEEFLERTAQVKLSMQEKAIARKSSFWVKLFSFFWGSSKINNTEEVEDEEISPLLGLVEDEKEEEDQAAAVEEKEEDFLDQAQMLAQRSLMDALAQSREHINELEILLEQQEQDALKNQLLLQTKQEQVKQMQDRLSILEEDTLLRKAAWKQLKNELSEEEHKRIDLEHKLKQKYEEIEFLEEAMKKLEGNYSSQVLQLKIENEQINRTLMDHIQTSDEIGIYVDRLEYRLVALSRAKEIAVLEAREAASNLSAIAVEHQKESETQLHMLQEQLRILQHEHMEEIVKYQEQIVILNETIDVYITEKQKMEGLLEEISKERDRLLTETSQVQLQMSELHWKLEAARCQVELLTSQAATANERHRLQAALDEYCSEEGYDEPVEEKDQNTTLRLVEGYSSAEEALDATAEVERPVKSNVKVESQLPEVDVETRPAPQPAAFENPDSYVFDKIPLDDKSIHDENGMLLNEKDEKRTDELQPSMSPTPETPSLPDSGAFSDDGSAEDDIDDQEENHLENEMLFDESERLEETQLSAAITEAELFSHDESFSDEESFEDEEVIRDQAVHPTNNLTVGAKEIDEIQPSSSQEIHPNTDKISCELEVIELNKEKLISNETIPTTGMNSELPSRNEVSPAALSLRLAPSDGKLHGDSMASKDSEEQSEWQGAEQKSHYIEKTHHRLETKFSEAQKGNNTLIMMPKRSPQKHKKFRLIRKTFSRMTGMHGFFSRSSFSIKSSRYGPHKTAALNVRFQSSKLAKTANEQNRSKN